MYLIDETYFNNEIYIPNIKEVNSDEVELLNNSINKYVRLFMQNLLGFENFEEFDSHIEEGQLSITAPQKWLDLVNGVTYSKNDKTYRFKGLIYNENGFNESLLAYFVYYNQYQNNINTSIGQVVVEPKNGVNVNPSEHLTTIWNKFIEIYQGASDVWDKGVYNINGTLFVDYFGRNYKNQLSGYVTLYQFLIDNKETYNIEPFIINLQNKSNRYGI